MMTSGSSEKLIGGRLKLIIWRMSSFLLIIFPNREMNFGNLLQNMGY